MRCCAPLRVILLIFAMIALITFSRHIDAAAMLRR